MATAINTDKGTAAVNSANKTPSKPNLNAKLPEASSTDPDDSESDFSLYGLSFTLSHNQHHIHSTITILVGRRK